MKRTLILSLLLVCGITLSAQIKNVKNEAEKQGTHRVNNKIDQGIDKGFDKLEEGIGSLFKKKKKKKKSSINDVLKSEQEDTQQATVSANKNEGQTIPPQPDVKWAKYDFVPGDEVIFEDGPSADEENGEFPSRWDLYKGNVEIGEVDGENVIMFLSSSSYIVPYLKNSNKDYLPDVFTLELDVWFPKGHTTNNRLWIYLSDKKNNNRSDAANHSLIVMPHSLEFGDSEKSYPGTEDIGWSVETEGSWKHISIAYTKGKFKAYFNDTRLINVPHLEVNPAGITIYTGQKIYIKNIRIAKGGVKYYDRVLSDGKIIVNGIRFDVNKATIKPESNGAINKIFQLMQKQPELNFSVEGHTDSDGDDALNQTLSEKRAKAVMDRLISMGISANRLKSAGWGESKPIDNNNTPEGKANNRRVEFVKFTGNATPSSGGNSNSGNANSAFDKLDKNTILTKLEALPEQITIPISNPTGILNGTGTIILYATSDGNLGKMEILDIDKNDNYRLTVKYVTFNDQGAVHSKSDHLEIEGTYSCDLDKGKAKDVIQSEIDFQLGRESKTNTTLFPGEIAVLKLLQ